jgi:hypothetical protein
VQKYMQSKWLEWAQNLPNKGRGQFLLKAGGRKYIFCPLPNGFKAPKFIYE